MLRLRTFGGLWLEAEDGSRLPSPRPRRLALLAILAAAGRRGVARSRLRALFWPDAEDEPARHALRQTLYALHRDLGVRATIAEPDLRLDPDAITCDTDDFRAAIGRRDWAAAQLLYEGPFAAEFTLPDAPEFERWLEVERGELARQAAAALESLAGAAEAAGDGRRAADAWQRLAGLDPLSARYAASYMKALAALGDRSGAIAHARVYAAEVRRDLDAEPDATVARLEAALRAEIDRSFAEVAAAPPPAAPPPSARSAGEAPGGEREPDRVEATVRDAPVRPVRWRASARRTALGGAAAALAVLLVGLAVARSGRQAAGPPVLAAGQVRDLTASDSSRHAAVLSDVLTTSMARLVDVEVIAHWRIVELLASTGDTTPSARNDAARRAGATEVVEGELAPIGAGRLRLDLRRVDPVRGTVRGAYSVTGTDGLALIDSATVLLAADLKVGRPRRPLAELTPRSPVALRLYEEGLRAYYRAETDVALRLFREAVDEDSTFALAAYYAYRAHSDRRGRDPELEALALRLSGRAPDRDRLIIQTMILRGQHDTMALVFADSLASRFPRDPEALVRAAEVLTVRWLIGPRARGLFERAIAIDSAAGFNPRVPCRICDAFALLTRELRFADAGAAADSVARRWLALMPGDAGPIGTLAMIRFGEGDYDAGVRALAELEGRGDASSSPGPIFLGRLLTDRFDEADAECTVHLGQEDPRAIASYLWLCPIVWRNQGRYQDASALVFERRLPSGRPLRVRRARDVVGEFVLDLELGRPARARRALEEVVPGPGDDLPTGLLARELSWNLARRGTAAAMAREIDLARRLADSAEAIGLRSLYGRDRLLHYFIRGLIARAANDQATAVDLFRRSIFSWNFGYTRANLEMARSLLALGRPGEAIAPLQASLRGGWDGSNLYVTRTELHEALAEAFAAAGQPDSAAAHYAVVERAWRRADPPFAARYQAARDFLGRRGVRP